MILGAVSVIAFAAAVRRSSVALSLASAALYLLAMLAEEIVVPLAFALVVLPLGEVRVRARHAIPHFVVLGVYLLWRWSALGQLLGGYGWAIRTNDWPAMAGRLPVEIVKHLAGASVAAGTVMLVIVLHMATLRRLIPRSGSE